MIELLQRGASVVVAVWDDWSQLKKNASVIDERREKENGKEVEEVRSVSVVGEEN